MTMSEDWILAKHLRLARQLQRAIEIYIARTTDISSWAHYRNDCGQSAAERPTVRPPRHLEALEEALLEHLPKRAVLWGVSEGIEAHQQKMEKIINEILSKENKQ